MIKKCFTNDTAATVIYSSNKWEKNYSYEPSFCEGKETTGDKWMLSVAFGDYIY